MLQRRLLLGSALALAGAAGGARAQGQGGGPIRIGCAGPMTGQYAAFGTQMRAGSEQAVADLVALVAPDGPGCVLPRLRALSFVVGGWYGGLLKDVRSLLVAREQGGGGRLSKLCVRVAGRPRDDAVLEGAHEEALAALRGVGAGEVVYVDER